MSFSHLTKYDDSCLLGLQPPHPLLHPLCMLIAYCKNSSNKLYAQNLDFVNSNAKQSKWLLEHCSCTHVILVLYKHNNSSCHKGLHPPHHLIQFYICILLYSNWKFIKCRLKLSTGYSFWGAAPTTPPARLEPVMLA